MTGVTSFPPRPDKLRVVLIGQFARVRRRALLDRLRAAGARVDREVSARVDCVVVGEATWRSGRSGRLPRGVMVAQILQARGQSPEVLSERQFLQRYPELIESVAFEAARDCADVKRGGLAPAQVEVPMKFGAPDGACPPFSTRCDSAAHDSAAGPVDEPACQMASSFREWKRAQHIAIWIASGVSPHRTLRALRQLSRSLPELHGVWERLAPAWEGRRLLLRMDDGRLVESTGQLLLDELPDEHEFARTLQLRNDASQDLFASAVACEQRGDFAQAEAEYRELLRREGPDSEVCFNLANVLAARGQRDAALERLWQCVELSPRFAEAWHNLGTVFLELRNAPAAEQAFARAVQIKPEFEAAERAKSFHSTCAKAKGS